MAPARPPAASTPLPLTFACAADNDLYRVLTVNGAKHPRFATPADAVKAAAEGSGVLILADGYPTTRTVVEPEVFAEAARKKLRLYAEYPQALPDTTIGDMKRAGWERAVVASDAFGPNLAKMRILHVQDCHFVPIEAAEPHLVLARVAGDGTWFRGFDFRRWDYWGSNADLGWGVWSTETGWTQGWIAGVLALRQLDSSFWDFTKRSRVGDRFELIRRQMLPDDALLAEVPLEPVRHAAIGRPVVLTHARAAQYAADGPPRSMVKATRFRAAETARSRRCDPSR